MLYYMTPSLVRRKATAFKRKVVIHRWTHLMSFQPRVVKTSARIHRTASPLAVCPMESKFRESAARKMIIGVETSTANIVTSSICRIPRFTHTSNRNTQEGQMARSCRCPQAAAEEDVQRRILTNDRTHGPKNSLRPLSEKVDLSIPYFILQRCTNASFTWLKITTWMVTMLSQFWESTTSSWFKQVCKNMHSLSILSSSH